MKRNQFLLTVIRLLVNAVFFYVLGIMSSNYIDNNKLLINVDEAIVSQSIDKVIPIITNDVSILFETPDMYTYVQEQATVARTMNAMWIKLESDRTMKLVEGSINSYAQVSNYQLDKPPRSDMIVENTS